MTAQDQNPTGAILTDLNDVKDLSEAWLWPGRIPLGAITTIVGYGGEGKSFFSCAVASIVSRGGTFCDGPAAPLGSVVVMAGEDLPAKLKKRYEVNGADLKKITLIEGRRIFTNQGPIEWTITLRDIDVIRAAIHQRGDTKLLIVDPIGDFIPGVNSDKDNEVRALLNPLAQLAKEYSLAVLLICHRKKSAGDRADNAALGSVAFTAKARAVHHVMVDPDDDAHPSTRRRLLLPGKLNDQEQALGIAFRIKAPDGLVEWDSTPVALTADAAMRLAAAKAKADRSSDPNALIDAVAWLRESLKEGPRAARELISEAKAEGVGSAPLRRAREKLSVTSVKQSFRGGFIWQLPNTPLSSEPISESVPAEAPTATTSTEAPPIPADSPAKTAPPSLKGEMLKRLQLKITPISRQNAKMRSEDARQP